jgi:acetoin utilization deacetylase AcuC-like enzyme
MALLYYDPFVLQHETGRHPECPARIVPAARRLGLLAAQFGYTRPSWKPLDARSAALAHEPNYIVWLERICENGGGHLDSDTIVSAQSLLVAFLSAGAVCDAVDQVLQTPEKRAFCLIRPPGHHALRAGAMGFCLLNQVAIAARRAIVQHGVQRVLIVDWDVHHGNGTQEIFWSDGQVGYFSIHRFPFFPGTGDADETGTGRGLGSKLNVPIEFGTSRKEFHDRFQRALEQISSQMQPELVLVSAGFDAHRLDPIGSLGLETEDFGVLTQRVVDVAEQYAGGRIVSALEGGYNAEILADCVEAHWHELVRGE